MAHGGDFSNLLDKLMAQVRQGSAAIDGLKEHAEQAIDDVAEHLEDKASDTGKKVGQTLANNITREVEKQKDEILDTIIDVNAAKKRIKELQVSMTNAAKNIKKLQGKESLSSNDYRARASYETSLRVSQQEIEKITDELKAQGVIVRNTNKEYKELQNALEDIGFITRKVKKQQTEVNKATENLGKVAEEASSIAAKGAQAAARAIEQQGDAIDDVTKKIENQVKATKQLATAQREVQESYESTSDIIRKSAKKYIGRDWLHEIYSAKDSKQVEGILKDIDDQIKVLEKDAYKAKLEFDALNTSIQSYTGDKLSKKSDFQKAIKDAWKSDEKEMAAKLFSRYQERFPDGKFNPDREFGDKWTNNFNKNLEAANRSLSIWRSSIRNAAEEYGKFIAYQELTKDYVPTSGSMSYRVMAQNRITVLQQEENKTLESQRKQKLLEQQVHSRFDVTDKVAAYKNLCEIIDEYNKSLETTNQLMEQREKFLGSSSNPDAMKEFKQLNADGKYKNLGSYISSISREIGRAIDYTKELKFGLTYALRVYRELGGTEIPNNLDKSLLKEIDVPIKNTTRSVEDTIQQQEQLAAASEETANARKKEADATRKAAEEKRKYYEIDEKAAKISKQNRSFDDYKDGSATASYKAAVDEIAKIVEEKKAQFPDKSEKLDQLLDRYAKNLATYINKDNQIGAQYPSVMISGAGNYNIKKHNRQMASWGKNYQYYEDKVAAIENQIRNFGSTGALVVRGDEEDALEKLEAKLEYMKYWHDVMVEVNKYYRKNKTLEGFEGVEPDELERIKKDLATIQQIGMSDVPYPSYTLSNDSQNIKRIEGRIAELKRLKGNDGLQAQNDIYKLWTDKKDMRIRISFEIGRPEKEIIDLLKGKGFKWSPKNQVWQRQLTDNAVYATKRLQEALDQHYQIGTSDTGAVEQREQLTAATETGTQVVQASAEAHREEARAVEDDAEAQRKLAEARRKAAEAAVQKPELLEQVEVLETREEMYDDKTIAQKRKVAEEMLRGQYYWYQQTLEAYESSGKPTKDGNLIQANYEDVLQKLNNLKAYVALYEKYGGKVENLGKKFAALAQENGFVGAYQDAVNEYEEALRIEEEIADKKFEERKARDQANARGVEYIQKIGELINKYDSTLQDRIFGEIPEFNVSNAEEVYNTLTAKEREYQAEIAKRQQMITEFVQESAQLVNSYNFPEEDLEKINIEIASISKNILQDGLDKENALSQLSGYLQENFKKQEQMSDATEKTTKALEEEYVALLKAMHGWQNLATAIKQALRNSGNTRSFRKQLIPMLNGVSDDVAKVIGKSFTDALKLGFKGIKTQDILDMIHPIANEAGSGTFMGAPITDTFKLLDSINLNNFNIKDVLAQRADIGGSRAIFDPLFNLLQQISDSRVQIPVEVVPESDTVTEDKQAQAQAASDAADQTERQANEEHRLGQEVARTNDALEQRAATTSASSSIGKIMLGNSDVTYAGKNAINVRYAVMSVEDLTMSHDAYGKTNPNYPTELQPRDRTRVMSSAQIITMANKIIPALLTSSATAQNGSPIVSRDGIVIGGNARSAALAEAYSNGRADGYKQYITEHASDFGLNPNNIPNNPVLVRVVDIEADLPTLAKQLNESTTAGYSATEQALLTEELVMKVISKLNLDESANLNSKANRDFVNSLINLLPDSQKNEMVTKDGYLSAIGAVKVKQALAGAAYGSREMLENLELISPELLNISNALMAGAAKAADIRYAIESGTLNDTGAISTILKGVDLLKEARRGDLVIDDYLNQTSMDNKDYSAEDVAIGKFLEANVRNAASLRNMIDIILDFARNAGDPSQMSFGGFTETTLSDVVRGAFAEYEKRFQKSINYDKLIQGYLPAEVGSRSDKRVDRTATFPAMTDRNDTTEVPVKPTMQPDAIQKEAQDNIGGKPIEIPIEPTEESEEIIRIIEPDAVEALNRIRSTLGDKKNQIDLSAVFSEEELKSKISEMVKNANQNIWDLGSVDIVENIAQIKLYNEELGYHRTELYQLKKDTEDATKANLEFIKTSRLTLNVKEQKKYIKAQEEAMNKSTKYLQTQEKALNGLERTYQTSRRLLKGNSQLLRPNDTTMPQGSTATLDSLVAHIRGKLSSAAGTVVSEAFKNEIQKNMNALDNEIKTMQNKQYAAGKMSASLVSEAKKRYENEVKLLESKAKKSNVFTELEQDLINLNKTLADSTDNFQAFLSEERTVQSKLRALEQEASAFKQVISLQERLTTASKDYAKYTVAGTQNTTEGQAAKRRVDTLEAQIKATKELITNKKYLNEVERQRVKLNQEVTQYKQEQANAKQKALSDAQAKQDEQNYNKLIKQQDQLYNARKKYEELKIKGEENTSEGQAAKRNVVELARQVAETKSLIQNRDLLNKSMSRTLQLNKELAQYKQEQTAAKAQAQVDAQAKADEQNYNKLIKLQEQLYNARKKYAELKINGKENTAAGQEAKRNADELGRQVAETKNLIQDQQYLIEAKKQQVQLDKQLNTFKQEKTQANTEAKQNEELNKLLEQRKELLTRIMALENTKKTQTSQRVINAIQNQINLLDQECDKVNKQIEAYGELGKQKIAAQDAKPNFKIDQTEDKDIVNIAKYIDEINRQVSAWKTNGIFDNLFSDSLKTDITDFQNNLSKLGLNEIIQQWTALSDRAKNSGANIKELYNNLLMTVKGINEANSKIAALTLKDGGTGSYAQSIQRLENEKQNLLQDYVDLEAEIQKIINVPQGTNSLEQFLKNAGVQAVLSTEQIQKLNDALNKTVGDSLDFVAKITSQVEPALNKLQELVRAVQQGIIDPKSNIANDVAGLDGMLNTKFNNFKANPSAANALDVTAYISSISSYIDALDKAIQKEKEYFANKTKYESGTTTMQSMAADAQAALQQTGNAEAELTRKAEEFAKASNASGIVVTKFVQDASGIARLDFSTIEDGTNAVRKFSLEMSALNNNNLYMTENTVKNTMASIREAATKTLESMSKLITELEAPNSGIDMTQQSIQKLIDLRNKLFDSMKTGSTATDSEIAKLAKDCNLAEAEVKKLLKQYLQMQDAINSGKAKDIGQMNTSNLNDQKKVYDELTKSVRSHAASQSDASLEIGKFNAKTNTLTYTLTSTDGVVTTFSAHIDTLTGKITTQATSVRELGSKWDQFKASVSNIGKQFMAATIGVNVFYKALSQIRRGYSYVKEIDLAMTELKKVTDETEAAYSRFLKTASTTAGKIGSTVSEFTEATANFARLGYSMEEAAKMAETAIVYKNVADGLDTVEESTDSIISTMKAFGIESSNTMSIIDKFNAVGNNFAITSAGIGEAFQRSAAALQASGNTIDEAIGLVTAANSVGYFG